MSSLIFALSLCCTTAPAASPATPSARIEMDLSLETGSPPTTARQWYERLTELKVDNLRLRAAGAAVEPAIATSGTAAGPVYKVTAMINRAGELLVPGGRFRAADRGRLSQWLDTLRQEGPERAAGAPRLPFGLSTEQFAAVRKDLARPVSFATKDVAAIDFANRLSRSLAYRLAPATSATAALRNAPVIDVDLAGMASGTALAFVLDRAGLAFSPGLDAKREPFYAISAKIAEGEAWPIGHKPERAERHVLPALFEMADVELKDVELPRVLAAVGQQVQAPVLVDTAGLAREKIDLAALRASLPAKRSMYEIVLGKILVPNLLTHELRVDEADKPFLWITPARQPAAQRSKDAKR
ncbi:MAG: hypothetical protein HYX69_00375 [Planctomycetia bacterium]|nr:hypothetical protein [Planctomycetia bacterium]